MNENTLRNIEKSISDLERQIAVGFSRIGLSSDGIPVNGLFSENKEIKEICKQIELNISMISGKIDELTKFKESTLKEISEIKESLKGNITLSGIHKFLMQVPAIATALGLIGGILFYFIKGH